MNKLKKLLSNYNNLEYNFSSNNSFTVQINKSETSNFKEVFSLIEHINLIEKFSCVKINQSSNVSLEFEFCNVARKYNTMYIDFQTLSLWYDCTVCTKCVLGTSWTSFKNVYVGIKCSEKRCAIWKGDCKL